MLGLCPASKPPRHVMRCHLQSLSCHVTFSLFCHQIKPSPSLLYHCMASYRRYLLFLAFNHTYFLPYQAISHISSLSVKLVSLKSHHVELSHSSRHVNLISVRSHISLLPSCKHARWRYLTKLSRNLLIFFFIFHDVMLSLCMPVHDCSCLCLLVLALACLFIPVPAIACMCLSVPACTC
jgi:hypothetical protein